MSNNDWTSFSKRIPIAADIEKVYAAWTTQHGIEQWFLRTAQFTKPDNTSRDKNDPIQKGDRFLWRWHGYPDSVFENREVIDANGKDFLQFTFSGNCLVTVSISQQEGMTICELKQEHIPEDKNPKTNLYVGCGEGWTFYLANLKSILEGGIDLRNKNLTITGIINS